MDYKLFFSTFVLIFLAELGDKTQLTAMAKSADGGKMTVFFAASAALVCSTFVAVVFGDFLRSHVPESYIKIVSGVMFLIFGALVIISVLRPSEEEVGVEVPKELGAFSKFVLNAAVAFEEAAEADYLKLAEQADDEKVRDVMLALAEEEKGHMQRIRDLGVKHEGEKVFERVVSEVLPKVEQVTHDVSDKAKPILAHAIEHERATATFYRELARVSHIPALKAVLVSLADEEVKHAQMLEDLDVSV